MNENKVKRRFGDRYEGRRIRGYNPMDRVAWYIMPRRNGATNLLAYSVDVASMEDYIRQKRAEGLDKLRYNPCIACGLCAHRITTSGIEPLPLRPEALRPQRDMGQYGR